MCGKALPCRAVSESKWGATPLVWPLAHDYWGKPEPGAQPSLIRRHRRGKASPHIRRQSRQESTFEAKSRPGILMVHEDAQKHEEAARRHPCFCAFFVDFMRERARFSWHIQ